MGPIGIHIAVLLTILSTSLISQLHGIEVTVTDGKKIMSANIEETPVQTEQIQGQSSVIDYFKRNAQNLPQNYQGNFNSSSMGITVPSGLQNISSNLQAEFDNAHTSQNKYLEKYIPCKEGWILYDEKCYQWFHNDRKTWLEARNSCEEEGGHLVTISSRELQDYLITFLMLNNKWDTWIGLNDLEKNSEYIWHDGSPLTFANWGPGEPSNRWERCVEMVFGNPNEDPPPVWAKLGIWNDDFCFNRKSYICQVDRNKDPRFCSIDEGGGFKLGESCFNIVRTKKTWEDAEKHCKENFRGHLVTIVDRIVELFLNYVLQDTSEAFWIGIKKQDGVGIQKWNSGFHVVYNRLYRDLKELATGTCVLRREKDLWTNAYCSMELPFICETTKFKDPIIKKARWQCPSTSKEWIDLEGEFCYIFGINKQMNWDEANADCKTKGGTLASITSKEEGMILHQYVLTKTSTYIGLRRNSNNRRLFEWEDGIKLEYTNWDIGQPNNENSNCVEVYSNRNTWNDVDCLQKVPNYICKVKKVVEFISE